MVDIRISHFHLAPDQDNQIVISAGSFVFNPSFSKPLTKKDISLIYEYLRLIESNNRIPYADTKTKGEVRGGGKKPHKQKGTGRARQGSIRSPHYRGGGVSFGPLSVRNYKKKMNKKAKSKAILNLWHYMLLRNKGKDICLIDSFPILSSPKTKSMQKLVNKVTTSAGKKNVLLLSDDEMVRLSARNIPNVTVCEINSVKGKDILRDKALLMQKRDFEKIINSKFKIGKISDSSQKKKVVQQNKSKLLAKHQSAKQSKQKKKI